MSLIKLNKYTNQSIISSRGKCLNHTDGSVLCRVNYLTSVSHVACMPLASVSISVLIGPPKSDNNGTWFCTYLSMTADMQKDCSLGTYRVFQKKWYSVYFRNISATKYRIFKSSFSPGNWDPFAHFKYTTISVRFFGAEIFAKQDATLD